MIKKLIMGAKQNMKIYQTIAAAIHRAPLRELRKADVTRNYAAADVRQ